MITIKILGTTATLDKGTWKCESKELNKLLNLYAPELLENYSPFEDLSVAELVVEKYKGKIIKITGAPKTVKGRIY